MNFSDIKQELDAVNKKLLEYKSVVNDVKNRHQSIESVDKVINSNLNELMNNSITDHAKIVSIKIEIAELRLNLRQIYNLLPELSNNSIQPLFEIKKFKSEIDVLREFLDDYTPALSNLISSLGYRIKFYNDIFYMSK